MTDGQVLRLEDETFDLGTSTFGLMFFPDPPAGLRELRRVLRPSGRAGIAAWDMTRMGLPQLIGAALARAVPDLPAPAPPPWAHLCEAAGLEEALRAVGFTDVAVHQVTHRWRLHDPALFFRHLPDWTPPLRPLFTSLPAGRSTVRPPHSLMSSESIRPARHAAGRRDRRGSAMMKPPGE